MTAPTYTESWVSSQWLYSACNVSSVTNLATGGVYVGLAPASAVCPYLVIRMAAAQDDLMVVGTTRIWSPQLWDVIAVGTNLQWEVVNKIAAAADAVLHGVTSGAPSGGIMQECTREREIAFDEVDEGVTYVYIGGVYLVKATKV